MQVDVQVRAQIQVQVHVTKSTQRNPEFARKWIYEAHKKKYRCENTEQLLCLYNIQITNTQTFA